MFSHAAMNRIFRLIWNEHAGAWVAVAESTRGRGKRNRSALTVPAIVLLGLTTTHASAGPGPATLPTNGVVVAGQAAIAQQGAAMTVTQQTQRSAIDWQTFNVGAAASVRFDQPGATAVTLNRVLDSQASQIFGKISANGQVFLTNPNGVYFSPSSSVDVGGLVATTHRINNADFMAGGTSFSRDGASGRVVNDGQLNASLGGYVALLAPEVRNNGVITAQAGTVALASGEAVSLQFGRDNMLAGVVATPSSIAALVENRQAILAPGGRIILSAQAANRLQGGVVNNSGQLEASGLHSEGGRIMLSASDGIEHTGVIRADGSSGGKVSLISDLGNPASRTVVDGAISARGEGDGSGGLVETSGSRVRVAERTRVDTRGAGGAGSWLLDPDGFTIDASGGDISGATLSNNLALSDVAIVSTSGGGSDGNVTVNDAVSWAANKLTLTATNNVNINAVMNASGSASLDLEPVAGKVNTALGTGDSFAGKVNFAGSGVLTIKNQVYSVINSLGANRDDVTPGTLQGIQVSQNGFYALGSDIDATPTAAWNSNGAIGMQQFSIAWGALDGLGHVITAPTIRNQSSLLYSLYGDSTVQLRNLGIVGGSVIGAQYASGLVGVNYGTISNSFSTMSVSGFQYSGGLVGENRAGVIFNSHAGGDVSGTAYVGGLVGRMQDGRVENSYARGNVTGSTAFIGGLVGNNYFGTIKSAYATGNVSGNQTVGGLVGINQAAGGNGSSIIDTYATGTVNGNTNVGGLVGENGSNISNSYAVGAVSINNGNTSVGGLVGIVNGPSVITSSVWDTQTTGQAASAGGTGQTTAQMKTLGTFTGAGWGFATVPVWALKPAVNGGYPCLTAFGGCTPAHLLTVQAVGSQAGNVYGDPVGSFSYNLFDGATLLDPGSIAALGVSVGGTALYSGAPGAGANAGVYQVNYGSGLALGGANADGYTLGAGSNIAYTISKRPLALAGTRLYDGGTVFQVGTLVANNLVGADCSSGLAACSVTGAATVGSKNVSAGAQPLSAGTLSLAGSSLDTNYTLAGLSGNGTITPRPLAAVASAVDRIYDGGVAAQASLAPGGTLIGGDTVSLSFTGASFSDKNVGAGKTVQVTGISLAGPDGGNYALIDGSASTEASITPRLLNIGGTGVDRVYDGGNLATVNFTDDRVAGDTFSVGAASSTFADKNVGINKAVSVAGLQKSGLDAANYTLAESSLNTSATVNPRPLQLTASAADRSYNGGVAATVTLLDDRIAGDVLTVFAGGSFDDKNVGTNKPVTVGTVNKLGQDAANYVLSGAPLLTQASITPRGLDVFLGASSRVYDGSTAAVTTLSLDDGRVFSDDLSVSGAPGTFANKIVGAGKTVTVTNIVLGGVDAGNYQLARTTATTQANITPRSLQVTASGNNRVYDGGALATVNLGDNRVAGDVLTLAATSAAFNDKNVGVAKPVAVSGISASGNDAGNYTLAQTSVATSANITPRPLAAVATAQDRVYDGSTASVVTLSDDRVAGDVLQVSGTGAFANKNVGAGKQVTVSEIGVAGLDAANYLLTTPTATTTAAITPRVINATATGGSRVYDGTTVAPVTLALGDSVVTGDVVSVSGTAAFNNKNVGSAKPIAVAGLALAGQDAANYALESSQASASGTVTARPLTVSASGQDRVYDGTTLAQVVLADNRVADDVLTLSNTRADFANKNAGIAKPVAVAGIGIGGSDAGNYALANSTTTTSATIRPRPLLLAISGQDRIYDGSLAAGVTFADNRLSGDVFVLAGSGRFADKKVGLNKAVAVTNIAASGLDAANYSVPATGTSSASISQRALAVTAVGIDKVFDAKVDATVNLLDNRVAGDILTLSSTSAFADLVVGSDKPVAVSGISVSGIDAANYRLANTTASTSADIVADSSDSVPRLPVVLQTLPAATRVTSPLSLVYLSAGAALGMPEGDGIKVTLVRGAAGNLAGMVAVDVPKPIISRGDSFSFPLPRAVAEVLAVGGARAAVTAIDGSALPGWLKYNAETTSFDVSAAPAQALPFEVKIEVDGKRWTLVLAQGG